MYAALFPGQGSQRVGMGQGLYRASPAAREVLDRAEAALPGLLKLMWEGPEEELRLTENQQPALLAVGYAAYRAFLERGGPPPHLAAGHSLGEWTALVAAEALGLEDALRLVRLRGRYMQEAVPPGRGAMAAVLKLPLEGIKKALEGLSGVEVANLNAPEQTVISGLKEAVEEAAERLKALRARVVFLPVSAPFHSSLMEPAKARLAEDLKGVPFWKPRFPVYSNVTARPEEDPERIKALLLEQITHPVRWVEILKDMEARGLRRFLEFGPGEVLKGLVARTLEGAEALSVGEPEDLEKAKEVADA
ncbi:malonyl CoA-acyl carrier protein transacylase [Thermus oshimai JL-2]|jgi:[acyl-carrier-protein] S-malonyltransferase|uniref:Malonyl CoA-acyl carrier protein transacylase n=1 Tax=Thermus oshimai JL-2 TaxID=751945 RepID=K7R4A5_THEOS|nr:ACP S-malonyltransferase [Thermus oshimai]AFV75734.1 malonyl CoA-acyl carrier protein transacylase [Thermus oshimai JL-2]